MKKSDIIHRTSELKQYLGETEILSINLKAALKINKPSCRILLVIESLYVISQKKSRKRRLL